MVRPVKVVKFSKLSFRDFPASCTYIFNQKDFEKELLTVSNEGTPYINSLHPDWKAGKEIIEELMQYTFYQLEQIKKLKKNSKNEYDVLTCKFIDFEVGRRKLERAYYGKK